MGKKIIFNLYKTYLSFIKKSVDARIFQSVFLNFNGKTKDAGSGGKLSCALYASSILRIFGLIKEQHSTVEGTTKDMEKSGWYRILKPKIGAVIIWEPLKSKTGKHRHNGFYVGSGKAVSNDSKKRTPQMHRWTYNGSRKVEAIFWNNKLNQ